MTTYRLQSTLTVESSAQLSARSLRYLGGMQAIAEASCAVLPEVVVSIDCKPEHFAHTEAVGRSYGPAFTGLAAIHPNVPGVLVRQSEDGRHTVIVWEEEAAFS